MSSNFVVALESYPGMTQKSWRVDEMGIHMTLLLWCNMALFTVCRENKQLRVICGEKNSPGRGISCTGGKKKKVEQSLQEISISVELFRHAGRFRMRSAQMDGTALF